MEISYLVIMYRWGDEENHSYPLGTYDRFQFAAKHGKREHTRRGGKYEPKIWELIDGTPGTVVKQLPSFGTE